MRSRLTPPLFLGDFATGIAGVIDRGDQKLPLLQVLKKVAVSIDLSRCERPGQLLRRGAWSWVTGEPLLRGGGIQRRQLRAQLLFPVDDAQHVGGHAGVKLMVTSEAVVGSLS